MNPFLLKKTNLMYLVLLAMMAVNVKVDFANTFEDVNKSIIQSNSKYISTNSKTLTNIQSAQRLDSLMYSLYWEKSRSVSKITYDAVHYLDSIRSFLLLNTGGYNEFGYPKNSVSSEAVDKIFIRNSEGEKIRNQILNLKASLLKTIGEEKAFLINGIINTENYIINSSGVSVKWEDYHFDNIALGGVLATLSRLENGLLRMESNIINYYYSIISNKLTANISSDDLSDSLKINFKLFSNKQFSLGDRIKMTTHLPQHTKTDSTIYTNILLDKEGNEVKENIEIDIENKEIIYLAENPGEFTLSSSIQEGERLIFKKEKKFKVVDTRVVKQIVVNEIVKLEYHDNLFAGVKQQIFIKHPQHLTQELEIKVLNGDLVTVDNKFYIYSKKPGITTIQLFKGNNKVGEAKFIAKLLPEPIPMINGEFQNEISANIFKVTDKLSAGVPSFSWNDHYEVLSFELKKLDRYGKLVSSFENQGTYFNSQTIQQIHDARKGDVFIFDKILVKSADERSREITNLILTIK